MHRAVGFILLVLLIGSPAFAKTPPVVDDDARKAKAAFQQGLTDYNLSHYDEALVEFEKAYRLKPDPAFLFNIAQCKRQLNRPQDAIKSYKAYLRESPADQPGRGEVQRLIAEMEKQFAGQQAAEKQAAEKQAADKQAADKQAAEKQAATGSAAGSATATTTLPDGGNALTASAPPPRKKKGLSKTAVWVTVGVCGAVVIGAVAVGVGLYVSSPGYNAPHTSLGNFGASF